MNHTYRLVWNAVKQLWQCVSENTRTKGKTAAIKAVANAQITPPNNIRLINQSALFPFLNYPLTALTIALLFTFTNSAWAETCPQPDGSQKPFIIDTDCTGEPGKSDINNGNGGTAIEDNNTNLEIIIKANVAGGDGYSWEYFKSDGNGGNGGNGGIAINQRSGTISVTENSTITGGVGGTGDFDGGNDDGDGGIAINQQSGTISVTESTVSGGYGGYGGFGGFDHDGGDGGIAINQQEGRILVTKSTISGGNGGDTEGAYGRGIGGIAIKQQSGEIILTASKVTGGNGGNGYYSQGSGGIAINQQQGGKITLIDSRVTGGDGNYGGDAIRVSSGSTIILAGTSTVVSGFGKMDRGSGGDISNGTAIAFTSGGNTLELQHNIVSPASLKQLKQTSQFILYLYPGRGVNSWFKDQLKDALAAVDKTEDVLSETDYSIIGHYGDRELTAEGAAKIKEMIWEPLLTSVAPEAGIIGNVVMRKAEEESELSSEDIKARAKTNTLVLGGDASLTGLSFDLSLLGEVALQNKWTSYLDDKPLRAFGKLEKRGTSTWQLTGTLDSNIIDKFDVTDGVIELDRNVSMGTTVYVKTGGILTTPAINASELPTSANSETSLSRMARAVVNNPIPMTNNLIVENGGVFRVIANNVNDYSRLRSSGDITLENGSQLQIKAENYQGQLGDELKEVLVADNQFNGEFSGVSSGIEDGNALFDFVADYSEANKMHLKIVMDKRLVEPEQPTTPPEEKPTTPPEEKPTTPPEEQPTTPAQPTIVYQPLLSGTTNRSLMESADLMHRYLPVDRCGAQGDNHAWINLLGSWSTQQADGKRSGYDANHQGIAMGSDRCFTENVKLGIYASAVHSKADSRGIADKHQMKANSWQVGLYGNAITSAKTDIEAYIGVGKAEIDGKRYTQLNQKLAKSDYNADMMSAGMGVNYHLSDAITPFLRLDYTRIGADSYHETGAELMNLTVKGQTSEALIARTGVKFDKAVTDKLSLYAKASVGVDLLHREQAITAAFSALPTNTFSVKNGKFGRVIGDIELGSTYHFTPNVSLQFGGQAIGREGSHSLGVQANFNIRF